MAKPRKQTKPQVPVANAIDNITLPPTPQTREVEDDSIFPPAQSLGDIYNTGLIPSNQLPASLTTSAVADKAQKSHTVPLALVSPDGQVFPPTIPYMPSDSTTPLYTQDEIDAALAAYDAQEEARVAALLPSYSTKYDPEVVITDTTTEEEEDGLYGEPLAQTLETLFPK